MGCVYEVKHLETGKRYIGATTRTLDKRKTEHLSLARKGGKNYFMNALRKHGGGAFSWAMLFESDDSEQVYDLERVYLQGLLDSGCEVYNTHPGGHGGTLPGKDHPWWGKKHSPETREKMRKNSARPTAKLNEEQVRDIKHLLIDNIPESEIARRFDTTQPNVNLIASGKRWAHVPYPIAYG